MQTSVQSLFQPPSARASITPMPHSRRRASESEVRALADRIHVLNGCPENDTDQNWLQARRELQAWGRTA